METYQLPFNAKTVRTLFTYGQPGLSTPAVTAAKNVGEHFSAIGNILIEGNVSPEVGAMAIQKLYEAKVLIEGAIATGWQNSFGKGGNA